MPIRPGLYAILALVPILFGILLQPLHSGDIFSYESNITHASPPRVLLLTAHPDDETFFFGPTLTSFIPSFAAPVSRGPNDNISYSVALAFPQVYSLCLSVGNADGLGNIRRRELGDSLDIFGVSKDKRWVLDRVYVFLTYLIICDTGSSLS
jgi:N-acetylglucosaminylphosphatidylinositol deacetylase